MKKLLLALFLSSSLFADQYLVRDTCRKAWNVDKETMKVCIELKEEGTRNIKYLHLDSRGHIKYQIAIVFECDRLPHNFGEPTFTID